MRRVLLLVFLVFPMAAVGPSVAGDVVADRVFADHDVVLRRGYATVATWLRQRFTGDPAPSTCP